MQLHESAVRIRFITRLGVYVLAFAGSLALVADSPSSQSIDDHRLINAKNTPNEWLTYGGNYVKTAIAH
jgi:hypothetical protein